jgi:hypothetical protein
MDLETVNRLINHYNITYSRDASPIWKGLLSLFPPCLIDLLAAQKYQQAIEGRFYGLRYGQYGYPKDLAAACKFNDELVKAGNQQAILRKCEGLAKGLDGYLMNLPQLQKFIEELVQHKYPFAFQLKAFGLKYGILGYEKDLAQARNFILAHGIPS